MRHVRQGASMKQALTSMTAVEPTIGSLDRGRHDYLFAQDAGA
jgi:hypothetical protein